jgi:RimJ/RimL family protein N-acetyltransferase
MTDEENASGQPVGPDLPGWSPPPWPPRGHMEGRYCRLEPVSAERHAESLFGAFREDGTGRNWTYLPYGPFGNANEFAAWIDGYCTSDDPLFFAIVDKAQGQALGLASYCRITPAAGTIEVGHIHYSEALKGSRAATEAMFLMADAAFRLGFRRYEWKCDALNAPSKTAALRLGFTYEGTHRQATVYKGRSRDTAWFSIIDSEWPALRESFLAWMNEANFDAMGKQRRRLHDHIRGMNQADPAGPTLP